ncbi:response regulator transcription factor [Cyanobacterium aponinum UTEX 3222]|uniref:Two component transcriptional regulator, LuxR family n=3 Tax=Cyanobacterium aponinum TaxID=379064 RepID=K9Z4E5_CYAAP|nr:response regulator transcription factor [Cyanobacterium aponinum]WRL41877.1 response regulator transcription factor [Cyanobacterium aponinum UTEX 3222]AFZ53243.1 two component transcriptional regulator, LuxR family [Cyanobacterium aponinum PCC 10605]MBD2394858.1 response regulator transcription factor [Cyanobacterium aponinum FACHB-4101]MTF38915.1 response regulator [Cyanobacterium aponinum 0216]PHV61075.1 DNA-binding response regulator [Cyanobacterium aponinum IPPAS B-1201]
MKDSETKKLLLIDDDPNLILLVKDYLEFNGYEVITANHGREAIKILEQDTPDLIICDVMMPEMDGYNFVQEIRQNPSLEWLPVIFLSAKGQSKDRIKGLTQGADVYMVKPFEPDELVAQVKSTLNQTMRLMGSSQKKIDPALRIQVPKSVELTPTETRVVNLVARGLSNKEISQELGVSQRTVESHVSNMLNKTGLHNRTELSRWAIQNELV